MPRKPKDPPASKSKPASAAAREVVNPGVNPVIEHTTPDRSLPFPVVAIGASAGGIEAVTALVKKLPADTGMAFVVVQHLSPAHESMLTEILGRATRLPVSEVKDDTAVEPDHVYVIPPNKTLAFGKGVLHLSARMEMRGQPRPIDLFMRSLAEEHGHKAIGVVLSGTGSDGTLGLEEIKAAGGITFAQDSTAEQTAMPRSAIAAGTVDFVLPPDEIARELHRIARHPHVAPSPGEPAVSEEAVFARVLDILRQWTGVDFANYKRSTLHRRITRRMLLHKLDGLDDYLRYVRSNPEEVDALYQDVLISVTSFFRNPEAYEALKTTVFPKLLEERTRTESVRVWALGCSTGEEAYSLAMAYVEFAEQSGAKVPIQVFATDLNGPGIDKARAGLYPKGIAQDVSPDRLRRFFVEMDGGYQVTKAIRDVCVFARQNVIADPPFSRIDLVACRNLLIYLEPVLQQRLIPLMHYALRSDGFLWLGSSETIGTYRDLFEITDTKHKIYRRIPGKRSHALTVPATGERWTSANVASAYAASRQKEYATADPQKEAERLLLGRYAPPGVLVNAELDVLQFRGDTGPYLAPSPGRASLNLLKLLREGLLVPVRDVLNRARREKDVVREEGLKVRADGGWREVDVVVLPVRNGTSPGAYLVLFEEPTHRAEARVRALAAEAQAAAARVPPMDDESGRQEVARLKQELSITREYLQAVIEQQEAANEELQSANEEIQSSNEELQSVNEELETSREEIQSTNEELVTLNDELHDRNTAITVANDDLMNLLTSVNIAMVILGPDLRIRRFTQAAEKILNVIHADIGRPITDIKLTIDVPDLEAKIAEVMENVTVAALDVKDRSGRWFSMRLRPYRTMESKIDGVVLLVLDVDVLKRSEQDALGR